MPEEIIEEIIEETPEDTVEEAVETPIETNPWDGFTPSKLGLEERYDKIGPEQFAKEIKFRNESYGRQSQELGDLRRKAKEDAEKLRRFMEAADKPAEKPADNSPDEYAIKQFYDMMENGKPSQALDLLLKDRMSPKFDSDDFKTAVQSIMQENLNQYHAYQVEENVRRDPDYPQYSGYIDTLRSEEHFGNTRRPEELLSFSKLVQENKGLADIVYSNMKQYPAMSFDDAKKFANLSLNHSSTEEGKREDYKNTVKKLESVAPTSNAQKSSEKENIGSMDDAFNL